MCERDRALVQELKRRLPTGLRSHLKKIIIFSSRVKGEAADESDLDVIALVDEKTPAVEKNLEDIAYQVIWEYNFKPIISLKVFSESQFYSAYNKRFSFSSHVDKKGVRV